MIWPFHEMPSYLLFGSRSRKMITPQYWKAYLGGQSIRFINPNFNLALTNLLIAHRLLESQIKIKKGKGVRSKVLLRNLYYLKKGNYEKEGKEHALQQSYDTLCSASNR